MNSNSLAIILIIFLISLPSTKETKFIEIKSLKSGKYFIVFDTNLFIYNKHLKLENTLTGFKMNSSSNLIIIKHIFQENTYIFCLINDYIYLYNENENKLLSFKMKDLIGSELLDYEYINIIPYNDNNKLKLIISSLKEELKAEKCFWFIGCWDYNYYYYNVYKYFEFNYNNWKKKWEFQFQKSEIFSIPSLLLDEKNICHILDPSLTIKCIYYDNIYFFPLQYNIIRNEFQKSNVHIYFENFNFYEITSSKSDKNNNYLICPLYIIKNNNNNFTMCQICDENKDFNDCDFVENLYEKDCSRIKSFFFSEDNKYVLICKTFDEFILLIIDSDIKKAINRKIIYIECMNNIDFNGHFSLLFNKSSNYYELITDYNFTDDKKCTFQMEAKDTLNNSQAFNLTFMETGNEEINEENNHTFNDFFIEEKTNKSKEDFLNTNMHEIMKDKELGKNYEIKGDSFTAIIKPTNLPRLPNQTFVVFDECEERLRTRNNISNSSIITFFQMEIKNEDNNALYDQIQYTAYDEKLNELDLSICEDIETQIYYAIKEDSNIDLPRISDYKDMGVDILNINDDFFTNLCYAFSSSNNDMILEDRIKYIFQNYSLCEQGCSYNNLDIVTRSIACDCKIQGNISTVVNPLVFDTGKETSFFDSNIGVSKCYNLVFSLNNKRNNIGFIIFCILIIIYIITIFVQIIKGIKKVSDFIYNEMMNYGYIEQDHNKFFEKKKKESKKVKFSSKTGLKKIKNKFSEDNKSERKFTKPKNKKNNKLKKIDSIKITQKTTLTKENEKYFAKYSFNSTTKIKKVKKKSKKKKEIDVYDDENNFGIIKINIDLEFKNKKYYPKESNQSLLNYTFDEAIKYDKRNILRVFYIYLLSKQIIFRTFFQKSPLELFPLKLTLFIFMLSCDLALNALFYFNDNISKKYHYAKNIFLFAFSNNLTIIIYSTLISYFILTLLSKLSNSSSAIRNIFRAEEEKIKLGKKYITKEETKNNIFNEIEKTLKYFKVKIFFLLMIETILILSFWYFVTAFCSVYSSTQTSWLLDTFLSILSRFIIEILFGFLFAKFYRISVASNIATLYKLLICIYDFS